MTLRPTPASLAPHAAPVMVVVVDTEEEFDWGRPLSRESVSVRNIAEQGYAQDILEEFGAYPLYAVDYPVAVQAAEPLRALMERGAAEIGAHVHPWVTPPYDETVNWPNSYGVNLPEALEQAKIRVTTNAVAEHFGRRPTIFKAGRYGFGARTARLIAAEGFAVDLSIAPHQSFAADGGPQFYGLHGGPSWIDHPGGLLSLPLCTGFYGAAARLGPRAAPLFDSRAARCARLPAALSRLGLLERITLSPEGANHRAHRRLLQAMIGRGERVFAMTYHSSSLLPGGAPYVRSADDRARFLATIRQTLTYFRDALGGRFLSVGALEAEMRANLQTSTIS